MKYILAVLTISLVLTNAYWAYNLHELSSEMADSEEYLKERDFIIQQTIPMLKEKLLGLTKEDVLLLSEKYAVNKRREIGNCVAVGFHIYKFDSEGKLKTMGSSRDIQREICPSNL